MYYLLDEDDDYEDDAVDEVMVPAAPDEEPEDDEDGPFSSVELYALVLIPVDELEDIPSGDDVEVTFTAGSSEGKPEAEMSAFITIVKPDVDFTQNEFVSWAGNDTLVGIDANGDYMVSPGDRLEIAVEVENHGDSNATDVDMSMNVTYPDPEDAYGDPVGREGAAATVTLTDVNMDGTVNATFEWTAPDPADPTTYTLVFVLDPDDPFPGGFSLTQSVVKGGP